MTPEQRFFFDLTGYLHVNDVFKSDELEKAQESGRSIHQLFAG